MFILPPGGQGLSRKTSLSRPQTANLMSGGQFSDTAQATCLHVGISHLCGRKPLLVVVNPLASLAHATDRASAMAAAHRRGIVAAGVALLIGCTAAAFAIAPLAPDAASLPQRLISEVVQAEPVAPQLESLAAHEFELSRSELTRSGDTAGTLLERLGVTDASAVGFLRSDAATKRLFEGRGGRLVQVLAGEDGRLKSLIARSPASRSEQIATHFTRLTVSRDAQGAWQAVEDTLPLQSQTRLASGTIRSSLFAASDEARIPDAIAIQIAKTSPPTSTCTVSCAAATRSAWSTRP